MYTVYSVFNLIYYLIETGVEQCIIKCWQTNVCIFKKMTNVPYLKRQGQKNAVLQLNVRRYVTPATDLLN